MDSCTDLRINCAVRKVMVRHWIDLGKLSIRTTRGVVRLSGALCRLPNAAGELNCALILTILSEIKRVPHVRRVTADFTNWTNIGLNGWTPAARTTLDVQKPAHKLTAQKAFGADSSTSDDSKVFEIKEEVPEETA